MTKINIKQNSSECTFKELEPGDYFFFDNRLYRKLLTIHTKRIDYNSIIVETGKLILTTDSLPVNRVKEITIQINE